MTIWEMCIMKIMNEIRPTINSTMNGLQDPAMSSELHPGSRYRTIASCGLIKFIERDTTAHQQR